MPNGRLYVFLHGLAAVHSRTSDFEVVLPNVPGHVQKAGSWLQETSIVPPGVLHLRGVRNGGADFSQQYVIHLPNASLTAQKRAATLSLPKPTAILSLLHAKANPPNTNSYVAMALDGSQTWDELATVQVLIYDYDDENAVSLEGHYWEPALVGYAPNLGGAISLHIISTSEAPEGKEHEDDTERVLKEVMNNYPGITYSPPTPDLRRPLPVPWFDPSDPKIYGISTSTVTLSQDGRYFFEVNPKRYAFCLAELEHPALRLARLGLMGHLYQRDRPLEDMWSIANPLGDQTSNCMTLLMP
jgi:hypothetical protein